MPQCRCLQRERPATPKKSPFPRATRPKAPGSMRSQKAPWAALAAAGAAWNQANARGDQAAKDAAHAQAEAIRTELAAGADLPAAFAAKAEAVSVWPTQTVTLGLDEALPEAVSQAAKALTPGQLSAVVTAEGRSFLLLGRELDQEAAAQALFDQRLPPAAPPTPPPPARPSRRDRRPGRRGRGGTFLDRKGTTSEWRYASKMEETVCIEWESLG